MTSPETTDVRRLLGAFYKTVDVMKSARNSEAKVMNVWADDMKSVEDVMLFLENLRDSAPAAPMTSREELLPCPFCGHELYRSPRHHNPKAYCVTEDCYGKRMSVVNLDDPIIVAMWNARAGAGVAQGGQEPASYRWRQPGNKHWIYDPTPEWIEDHKHEIELEALFASPVPSTLHRGDWPPAFEPMKLQARPPDGGDWIDIFPAQLQAMVKNGCDVRAIEPTTVTSNNQREGK